MLTLTHDISHALIPNVNATRLAGYDANSRVRATVYHAPVVDGEFVYYCAGADDNPPFLVCRRLNKKIVEYVVNCDDVFGDRCAPSELAIHGTRIYVTSGAVPILAGPTLAAINKTTGRVIWTFPFGATTLDHARVSELQPVVADDQRRLVLVGMSSRQHERLLKDEHGMPVYTDGGALVAVHDMGPKASVAWRIQTCARPLYVGDVIRHDHPASPNPFRPGQTSVVVAATAEPHLVNAYSNDDKCTPIAALETADAPRQPVWNTPGITIRDAYDNLIGARRPNDDFQVRVIYASVPTALIDETQDNDGVLYFKVLKSGHRIATASEAQGLGYYGNGVWGRSVAVGGGYVYFGTGQAHSIPVDDILFTHGVDVVDSRRLTTEERAVQYAADNMLFDRLLSSKKSQCKAQLKWANNTSSWSPRAKASISDGLVRARLDTGEIESVTRTCPLDLYNQIPTNPVCVMYPLPVSVDGDLACGVFRFSSKKKSVTVAPTRAGTVLFVDHKDRSSMIVSGTPSMVGGASVESTSDSTSAFACQVNRSWIRRLNERHPPVVTSKGDSVPDDNAVVQSFDPWTASCRWETALDEPATSDLAVDGTYVYAGDLSGAFYVLCKNTGKIRWKSAVIRDGTPSPALAANAVVLAPKRSEFGFTVRGGAAAVYRPTPSLAWHSKDHLITALLSHRYYEDEGGITQHTWKRIDGRLVLVIIHDLTQSSFLPVARIRGHHVYFKSPMYATRISCKYVTMTNIGMYRSTFSVGDARMTKWFT